MATATISVYFKLSSGKAFSAEHLPSDTVKVVANGVAKTEGFPKGRVRLKYQGKTLDMTKTIGYLGVCAETILKVELIAAQDWTVQIKLPDGNEESIGIQNIDTARRLKQIIADISGAPEVSRQNIKVRGGRTVNIDDAIIMDLGVTDGAVLDVSDRGDTPSSKKSPKMEDEELDEDKKMELMSTFDTQGKQVDVVFCFDTTGSMFSCLETVRQKLGESCRRLLREIPNMRIGIIAHGDYCDYSNYVLRYLDLTSDVQSLVDFADDVPSTCGGDNPECYEWALRKAQQLDWSEDSAKALVMIGDALPHPPSYTDQNIFWRDELDVLKGMGVKVYGVQALNQTSSTPFYQEMSERTNGYYMRLRNFSLITDMFLAVCFRESDQQQLEAFVEEVKTEGRMTEDAKQFLKALETENKPSETTGAASTSRTGRSVNADWWNLALDHVTSPQYMYDVEKDKWAAWEPAGRAKKSLFKRLVRRIFR